MGIEGVGKLGMGVVEGGVQGRWLGVSVDGCVGVVLVRWGCGCS